MKMRAWEVWLTVRDGRQVKIETVHYTESITAEEVKQSLVDHDHFNPNIIVVEVK